MSPQPLRRSRRGRSNGPARSPTRRGFDRTRAPAGCRSAATVPGEALAAPGPDRACGPTRSDAQALPATTPGTRLAVARPTRRVTRPTRRVRLHARADAPVPSGGEVAPIPNAATERAACGRRHGASRPAVPGGQGLPLPRLRSRDPARRRPRGGRADPDAGPPPPLAHGMLGPRDPPAEDHTWPRPPAHVMRTRPARSAAAPHTPRSRQNAPGMISTSGDAPRAHVMAATSKRSSPRC